VHLTHADGEGADEVEAGFLATALGYFVLKVGVLAGDLGDGAEEEMGAVGEPAVKVSVWEP